MIPYQYYSLAAIMLKIEALGEQILNATVEQPFDSTKERLSPDDVLYGLLDHGLFAEKVPPCFTSVGLADYVSRKIGSLPDGDDELKKKLVSHDYIRYEALRDSNIPRHLGIPHPKSYAMQALAIKKHWGCIAEHMNKPELVFSRIHVRRARNGRIFEMNYMGRKSKFEKDELVWMLGAQYMVAVDIAQCFSSIYTHSIPWALHGKDYAKEHPKLNEPGNLLDQCTRNTKDKQTNGLLIGPHASNIISEIILTTIDANLQEKGYKKVKRYIDDYCFYAATYEEAELFIKEIGLQLRTYEMSLNEKKTKILPLPRPSDEDWVLVLNRHQLPKNQELKFRDIRSYLDLALTCAQTIGKSTPLNYAIKVLAKTHSENDTEYTDESVSRELNSRAKWMYTQETMNLALMYPYLTSLLDDFVFSRYWHDGLKERIARFSTELVKKALRKLYPDAIAHAIFLALKYDFILELEEKQFLEIVNLDDCVANVMLLEYSIRYNNKKVKKAITQHANKLKQLKSRDIDKHWLLIYQLWTENELQGKGQTFLAKLKKEGFQFFSLPTVQA